MVQFTRNTRYQVLLERAEEREVLGQRVLVASLTDLIQDKVWAWQDPRRRLSKRVKDEADLLRVGETYPDLRSLLPETLRQRIVRAGLEESESPDAPFYLSS
jgi:hypothetical protein